MGSHSKIDRLKSTKRYPLGNQRVESLKEWAVDLPKSASVHSWAFETLQVWSYQGTSQIVYIKKRHIDSEKVNLLKSASLAKLRGFSFLKVICR